MSAFDLPTPGVQKLICYISFGDVTSTSSHHMDCIYAYVYFSKDSRNILKVRVMFYSFLDSKVLVGIQQHLS